jgi:nucleotide-binding universal stress UspA family protein
MSREVLRTMPEDSMMPKKIIVAVEGSQPSQKAANYALRLASLIGSQVTVVYVIMLPQYIDDTTKSRLRQELTARGEIVLREISSILRGDRVILATKILETDTSIATAICNFSEREGGDLLILGVRTDASPVARLMLGSVAAGVANNATCPVLVVR